MLCGRGLIGDACQDFTHQHRCSGPFFLRKVGFSIIVDGSTARASSSSGDTKPRPETKLGCGRREESHVCKTKQMELGPNPHQVRWIYTVHLITNSEHGCANG